jgi:hypothetical protein
VRPVARIFFGGHRRAKHKIPKAGFRCFTIPGKNEFCLMWAMWRNGKNIDYFLDFYHREFLRLALSKQGRETHLKGEKRAEKIMP